MKAFLLKSNHFLERPLGGWSRIFLVTAAVLLVSVYVLPLWNLTMFAPQYPDGLRLDIYSYKLEGGNAGQDLREINLLNHYIGMKDLAPADFNEFKWMPFVVGMIALLFLRAAVLGTVSHLVDALVLYAYFALYSLFSFAYKLYSYGHNLATSAPVRVEPFMPPLFGHRKIANFDIYSYPQGASYLLALAAAALVCSALFVWRERRVEVV